jgi:hypothetical protein
MRSALQTRRLRFIVIAIVCGVLLALATGLIENQPEASITIYKFYGYPLVWRMTDLNGNTQFVPTNFAIDAVFWIIISILAVIILEVLKSRVGLKYGTLLLPLVLFIPLGLLMDFVHEFGHVIWGTVVGGRLTSMKVAYFEIYPQLAITSKFQLGLVTFTGLPTEFAYGAMQLGGSLTTNLVSWFLALILLRTSLRFETQVALRTLGLIGFLDLPFYVLFPQIGLRHWIFLGGCQPEPLVGARKMGIPDPMFYLMVILTTLGLVFIYFKPLWEKAGTRMKTLLGIAPSKHGGTPED